MTNIESRVNALGLVLPPAFTPPPGIVLPFVNVRLIGDRAVIAGHGPQSPEGPLAQPLGKVGRELTLGFVQQPAVINGFSDLILELWGPEAGAHARSAVGMAELPFGMPVEIEGEVQILA